MNHKIKKKINIVVSVLSLTLWAGFSSATNSQFPNSIRVAWLGVEELTNNFTRKYAATGSGLMQVGGEPSIPVSVEIAIAPSKEVEFAGRKYNEVINTLQLKLGAESVNTKNLEIRSLDNNDLVFDVEDDGEVSIYDYYARPPAEMKVGERALGAVARSYKDGSMKSLVSLQIREYSLNETSGNNGKFEFCETTRTMKFEQRYEIKLVTDDCLVFDRENEIKGFVLRLDDREDNSRFEVTGTVTITN